MPNSATFPTENSDPWDGPLKVYIDGAEAGALADANTYIDGALAAVHVALPGPVYNLKAENYLKWRIAKAAYRAGTGRARLWCIGDSTTAGGMTLTDSYPAALVRRLRQAGESADLTTTFVSNGYAGGSYDPRTTFTGSWNANGVVHGCWYGAGAGTLSYIPNGIPEGPASFDTLDVYFYGNSGGGSATINVNGGSTITTLDTAFASGITGSGAAAVNGQVYKRTVALGSVTTGGTINVVWASGGVLVTAMDAYNLTTPHICVGAWGVPSSKVIDWVTGSSSTLTYAPWKFPGDLNVIDLGINDAFDGLSAATYATDIQTIITNFKTVGDVILKSMVPSQGTPYTDNEPGYVVQLVTLANTNNLAMTDGFVRWGSAYLSTFMSSAVHPNRQGTADVAELVNAALKDL